MSGSENVDTAVYPPSPDGPFVTSETAARSLRGAHGLACKLYRDLDRSDHDGETLDRVAIDLAGTFDMAGGNAKGLYMALGLDRYLGFVLGLDLKLEQDVTRQLYFDLNSARDRALSLTGSPSGEAAGDVRSLLVEHARLRARAADIASNLGQAFPAGEATALQPLKVDRVTPWAGRLLVTAARLLPTSGRARYCEEWRSELWEIAAAQTGRRPQYQYAARQLLSVVRLRAAMLSHRGMKAAP
jgi:hypothetical protein